MTDAEILDWIDQDERRCQDLYWHIQNEGGTVREAAEKLAELQAESDA